MHPMANKAWHGNTRERQQFFALLVSASPGRSLLSIMLLLMVLEAALSLLHPLMAGELTNVLLADTASRWQAPQVLLGWFGLMALSTLLGLFSSYYAGMVGEIIVTDLRRRLYEHTQALPLGFYHQNSAGDVLAILGNDAYVISGFIANTLVRLLPLLLTFAGAFLMMALISPLIAALTLTLLPAYYLLMKITGRYIRPLSRNWMDSYGRLTSLVSENLGLLPAIKAFAREPLEQRRFDDNNSELLGIWRKELLIESLLGPAATLIAGIGLLGLLWLGNSQIEAGQLQPAQLVSLLLYARLMSQPVQGLANVYGRLQQARGAAERIIEFFEHAPEPSDAGMPDMPPCAGQIRFNHVDFYYLQQRLVLKNFCLDIAPGETVAITGKNGAGKSTVAHLLMRFADPVAGKIEIDGRDISQFSLSSLRKQIGLVAQHTLLLNATVAQNIAYGLPGANEGTIASAAKKAHASDFIEALPQGYNTLIGEQGVRLSGGQRQRLALARALLIDPPILIFDEATAMFDPQGELDFIDECQEILAAKTVLLITHRPASLAVADRTIQIQASTPDADPEGTDGSNAATCASSL